MDNQSEEKLKELRAINQGVKLTSYEDGTWGCDFCDKYFKTVKTRDRHLKSKGHNNKVEKNNKELSDILKITNKLDPEAAKMFNAMFGV